VPLFLFLVQGIAVPVSSAPSLMAPPQGPSPDVLPALPFSPHQVHDLKLVISMPSDRLSMAGIAVPAMCRRVGSPPAMASAVTVIFSDGSLPLSCVHRLIHSRGPRLDTPLGCVTGPPDGPWTRPTVPATPVHSIGGGPSQPQRATCPLMSASASALTQATAPAKVVLHLGP
jgi:hypothetical protein